MQRRAAFRWQLAGRLQADSLFRSSLAHFHLDVRQAPEVLMHTLEYFGRLGVSLCIDRESHCIPHAGLKLLSL